LVYDYLIVGGGIIGVSTAWQLQQRQPTARIMLVEKENSLAQHQTGHNSGVIHAGVYYAPGSLKARFCKIGSAATKAFCQANDIPFEECGKLLVATSPREMQRMAPLHERCLQNELDVELITQGELRRMEPNIFGLGAIFVPTTGIVDYRKVCMEMAEHFRRGGGRISLGTKVVALRETKHEVIATTSGGRTRARFVVACAGLMADRFTKMLGIKRDFQTVPYRGEYFRLPESWNGVVRHLIYPIPDPELPFLGVHLTRMMDGGVTVGPNAVQGWKREGYGRLNISLQDVGDMVRFPGFWRVLRTHWRTGFQEAIDSLWKPGYLKRVRKYCPQLRLSDLMPYPAGIRAQAVLRDGTLVHDFLFAETERSLHVCNAPSPAATSAIPIGSYICDKVLEDFQ
jgi:L-2-hydroxyglutarate oxidase